MVQVGENLTLGTEAADDFVAVHAPPDQLDRDTFFELLVGPFGQVDGPHATAADFTHHPVGADALACCQRRSVFRKDPEDGSFDEVSEVGLGLQQRLHLKPQIAVALTVGVEKSSPLHLVELECPLQDGLDLLPTIPCHRSPGASAAPSLKNRPLPKTRETAAERLAYFFWVSSR